MDDVRGFLDACQAFFDTITSVAFWPLLLAVSLHVLKLLLRGRAWQNILRASYPGTRVPYWGVFGSYMAGVGVNSLAPARGGDLVKLYLVRRQVDDSSYPTLASSLVVETLFDVVELEQSLAGASPSCLHPPRNRITGLSASLDRPGPRYIQ